MALKITEVLKQNGMDAKGTVTPPSESAEEKLAREERERLAASGGAGESAEEKLAREERERLAASGGAKEPEIDDAAVIAYLKKNGKNIESLDEIGKPAPVKLTEEEERQAAQQRQDNIRQFALQSKKATSTDFDNYIRETSAPKVDLAFNLYKAERLEKLKKANTPADQIPNDEALLHEFKEVHHLYAEEGDAKRERGEQLIDTIVDTYIENKYANILDLEEEYDGHQQITQKRTAYNQVIDTVVNDLGTEQDFEIIIDKDKGTKFPFKYKVTPEVQKALKKTYLSDVSFNAFGQSNVDKTLMQQAIKGTLIQQEFANIISEGALAYASTLLDEKAKGRRGIIPSRKEEGGQGGEKNINKVVKGILESADNKKVLQ